jgi:hypothetical protein
MSDTTIPHLRFLLSEELHEKTIEVLNKLEHSDDPMQYRKVLGDLVVELTNAGMDYFFIKPLELAKVGFMTQQSANLGLAAQRRVISPIIRRIISGMDKNQLLIICSYIRQLRN